MNRYKLQTGPDGTIWVSLNPLLADLQEQHDLATEEHVKTHLYSVLTFVQALIVEQQLAEKVTLQ